YSDKILLQNKSLEREARSHLPLSSSTGKTHTKVCINISCPFELLDGDRFICRMRVLLASRPQTDGGNTPAPGGFGAVGAELPGAPDRPSPGTADLRCQRRNKAMLFRDPQSRQITKRCALPAGIGRNLAIRDLQIDIAYALFLQACANIREHLRGRL